MELIFRAYADACEELRNPSYVNLALSLFILIGILISYLPQHYRIISRGTSEGISPYFILLGATSGTSAFATILVLPRSRADVACCQAISSFECFSGLLGIAQVGTQWFCFTVILLLFLIFFPRTPSLPENTSIKQHSYQTAVTVAFICLLHGLAVIFVSFWLILSLPNYLQIWANTLGISSAILAIIQYFPQIWTTYHLRHVGSLSIPMMVIQTPGSFVWAGSLIFRYGTDGWSSWAVFLITGFLQGCLLVMGVYFEILAHKAGIVEDPPQSYFPDQADESLQFNGAQLETDDEGHAVVENGRDSERTPLLGNSRKPSRT